MSDSKVNEMLSINVQQKHYYDIASGSETSSANSLSTNVWRKIRKRAFDSFSYAELRDSIKSLHSSWIGDVSDKKVLDLGVGMGNPLSLFLASRSKIYIAVDLSDTQIESFRQKLEANGISNAQLYAIDFLSDAFTEDNFDIIYAISVLHHFKHFDDFVVHLSRKLAPGGRIITYDPSEEWLPARLLRHCFRPFQTDAAWEFPFNSASHDTLEKHFEIIDRRGVLGRGKWSALVGLFSPQLGKKLSKRWHAIDLRKNVTRKSLRNCLHVTYNLRKI